MSESDRVSETRADVGGHVQNANPRRVLSAVPTMASRSEIERIADTVRKHFKLNAGAPLEPLVKNLGGRIAYRNFSDATVDSATIRVFATGRFDAIVPDDLSPNEHRLTLGRILGYYFLHFPMTRRQNPDCREPVMVVERFFPRTDRMRSRVELEAHWFATALLMPQDEFSAWWEQHASATGLAFGVAPDVARSRAERLGLRS